MTTPVRLDDLIDSVRARHPEGPVLVHLSEAVATAGRLDDVADHLVGHFVDQARRSGASWAVIGTHLGVTKQAAQQRFVPRGSGDLDLASRREFGRFTPRATVSVERGREFARGRGDHTVEPVHLLAGLLTEPDGFAGRCLAELAGSLPRVAAAVDAALGPARPPVDSVRFGRAARKVLDLAGREALRLGHDWVGTEHLLLAAVDVDADGGAVLSELGVTRELVAQWVTDALATAV